MYKKNPLDNIIVTLKDHGDRVCSIDIYYPPSSQLEEILAVMYSKADSMAALVETAPGRLTIQSEPSGAP